MTTQTTQQEYKINREHKKVKRYENFIFWIVILGVAFFTLFFDYEYIFFVWAILTPYFLGLLVHHYIYVPTFLLRNRYAIYFFQFLTLLIVMVLSCEAIVDILFVKYESRSMSLAFYDSSLLGKFVIALIVLVMNMASRYTFHSIKQQILAHETEEKLLRYKMEFLQFQVSPHFLMNTLNNIHVLVDVDKEKAKNTIITLSRMLRYMLYESRLDSVVSLERQLEFFREYCDLNLLRYEDNVKVNINVPRDIPNVQLPPLIMIVFIENAFKHGVVYGEDTQINMNFSVEQGWFHFTISNTIFPDKPKTAKAGGLGIRNVKERLNLLYGDNYQLTMEQTQTEFIVNLRLPV